MGETAAFGELLRGYRREAGMTIQELAAASDVSVRAIGDMERGRSRRPRHRTVAALARTLGLSGQAFEALSRAARRGRIDPVVNAAGVCGLPRDVGDFTGRCEELAWLERLAAEAEGDGPTTIATISGGAGLGKTALVVHAARLLAGSFPGGTFFIDLRGMDEFPVGAGAALSRLLRASGASESSIPEDEEDRAGYYRSLLHDRRCLIVLDSAADESQVRPLLPGGGGSLVLITSRRSLAGLEAVRQLPLREMPSADAVRLLRTIVGAGRCHDEGELDTVATLCGNLPLALRIAGNRLLSRPAWPVGHLADRLADEERRLALLSAGDLHVAMAFTVSYRHLSTRARALFRRLAVVAGPDFSAVMGSVLGGVALGEAEVALEELVELGLLQSPYVGRYRLHDLVRLFACARLAEEEPAEARKSARDRMNTWLLDNATVAGRWFEPDYGKPPADFGGMVCLDTRQDAQVWLEVEGANWLAALRAAAADGRHAQVVEVAGAMHWFSDRWLHWGHWHEVFQLSRAAAHAMGDRRAEAVHSNYVAWALDCCEGRYEESVACSLEAYELARAVNDLGQQGWALSHAASSARRLPDAWERAAEYSRRAAALFESAGEWDGYPQAVMLHGDCLQSLGHVEEALQRNSLLLAKLRDPLYGVSPDVREISLGLALRRLGRNHAALGDWQEAARHWREAVSLLRAQGAVVAASGAARDLGKALRELGHIDAARDALEGALAGYVEAAYDDKAAEVRGEIAALDI